ncbi:hypothetical protein LTR37_006015 [Vermiconidia calcicola]|uniref:Uncharacterized protein n=1 Tax=Vermiconidia calcicola TaxID=1690605 RepID=A0ACC3NH32_9PEZI|nr:hypothetical protein LTR37_006015 [Vermiconidia calcicola]
MDPDNPKTYGINLPTAMVIAAFCAIAWVNTIELQGRIWLTFKSYSGLYFWSLVLSSLGCAFHALGFIFLDFLIIRQNNAVGIIIGVSWWCMVTGQALVLYSRLHLVVRDERKIRWVLIMIITNFFILHLPIMLLSQVAYSPVPGAEKWLNVYNVYEKVQMTGFTIQETIISGLYLYEARRILRPGKVFQKKKTSQVLHHLIWVNIFIIFLDMALLATEYAGLFSIQTVFKAAVYSVKLRFEFVVLNQLMDIVGARMSAFTGSGTDNSGPYDTARSAQNVQLGPVNPRRPGDALNAFASPGIGRATSDPNMGDVLRTTEVHVHGTSKSAVVETQSEVPAEDYGDVRYGQAVTTMSRGRTPSRASSEMEFAGRGAYPS